MIAASVVRFDVVIRVDATVAVFLFKIRNVLPSSVVPVGGGGGGGGCCMMA